MCLSKPRRYPVHVLRRLLMRLTITHTWWERRDTFIRFIASREKYNNVIGRAIYYTRALESKHRRKRLSGPLTWAFAMRSKTGGLWILALDVSIATTKNSLWYRYARHKQNRVMQQLIFSYHWSSCFINFITRAHSWIQSRHAYRCSP